MGFREQPAIEEHAAGQRDAPFAMPRQQLLGDAVAIVMRQHMDRTADTQLRQQCLLQVGLLDQAVGVPAWLGRIAEAEHVACSQPVTRRQRLPDLVPVPAGGGKAMDQQQRLTFAGRPVANALAAEREFASVRAPRVQCHAFGAHTRSLASLLPALPGTPAPAAVPFQVKAVTGRKPAGRPIRGCPSIGGFSLRWSGCSVRATVTRVSLLVVLATEQSSGTEWHADSRCRPA